MAPIETTINANTKESSDLIQNLKDTIVSVNYMIGPDGSSYFFNNTYADHEYDRYRDFITMPERRDQARIALSNIRKHLSDVTTSIHTISRDYKERLEQLHISYFEEFVHETEDPQYDNLDTLSLPDMISLLENFFIGLDWFVTPIEREKVKKIHTIAKSINTKTYNFITSFNVAF